MNNEKLVINPSGEKLLLGAHFHELQDKTATTFETEHLGEFARFMSDKAEGILILCGDTSITAQAAIPDRYTKPVAVCSLEHSEALTEMLNLVNKKITMGDFTEFLESFKRFTSQDGVALLDNLRNFKLKKVMDVESSRDNRGNFSYKVSLESAGKEDFQPPKSLVFAVPMWKHVPDNFTHSFELQFSVVNTGANPSLAFVLKTFDIEDRLQERKKEVVEAFLASCPQVKMWGKQNVHKQDDAWRYFSNPLPEGEAAKRQIEANNAYRGR